MKKIYLLFIHFIWSFIAVAQSEALKMTSVPPSPNAAQLGKYGEIPLNLSTGAPIYNIPIYKIAEGDLNWSIDLNYSYTGFRPSEGASWVGRGWTLSGGGIITRTTLGIRDESVNGYFSKGTMVATSLNEKENNLPSTIAIHEDASKGVIDGEPDMFHFNFGIYSGKFFYGIDGQPHIVSNRKIKIERVDANTTTEDGSHTPNRLIMKWTLTTEDGTIYIFDVREYTVSSYLITTTQDAPSTWHLSEIISPSGRKLKFHYTTLGTTKSIQTSFVEKGVSPNCPNPSDIENCLESSSTFNNEEGVRYNYSEERFLTKIESASSYNQILFNTEIISSSVEDQTSTSRRLTGIDVKDKYSTELVGSYEFKYDEIDKYALTSYGEVSKVGEKKPPFKFNYIRERVANVIPGYTKALDYWGYYNAAYNISLIPQKGANRVPSFDEASTGALSKITYPTGGTTKFEYEQNEYSYTSGGPVAEQQVISELHQFTIRSTQGIGNVGFTVPEQAQYFIEYQCAKDPSNSNPNPSCNCPWSSTENKKLVYPVTKLQPSITYNVNDFITSSILSEVGCYDDLIIVAKVTVYKPVGNNKKFGPGIRVKKTISSEIASSTTPIVKEYFYNSVSDPTKSSGGLNREPLFAGLATFPVGNPSSLVNYNFYRTESIVTIGSPFIVYEDVEERTNGTNKIIYNYSSYKAPNNDNNTFPYNQSYDPIGTTENYDFTRGLLLSKKIYKGITNTIVSQTDYTYVFQKDGGPGATLGGYKTPSFYYEFLAKAPGAMPGGDVNVGFGKFYLTASGWLKKTGETTVVKDMDGNNPMTTTINYTYETSDPKHLQVIKTSTQKSDGSSTEIINKYPLDYESVSPKQSFITEMIANNIVNPVIEQQKWVNRGGVRTLVGTNLNYFKSLSVNTLQGYISGNTDLFPKEKIIVPDKQYLFYSNQPIDETTANTKLFTGYTFDNSIYRQKFNYESFDAKSNLRQQIHLDSDNTAYLWGYKGRYLIAEIKNCTISTLEAALATIGSSIADIYILEYEPAIRANMLALRGALPNSLITSYTYFPLIGVATETDPSGNKTRYVYDTFNRLKEVYNTNDKLVKSYKYEYKIGEDAIVINNKPSMPVFVGNKNICSGNSTTIAVSNCDGEVIWDNEAFIGSERVLSPTINTTYTAICRNDDNVVSEVGIVTINVSPTISSLVLTSDAPKTLGTTLNITTSIAPIGSYSYTWSGPNGFTSSVQNPTINNIEQDHEGIYTVSVLNASGCTASATTNVKVILTECNCESVATSTDWQSEKISNDALFTDKSINNIVENSYLAKTQTIDGTTELAQTITYIDGLGRPIQNISRKVSPTGKDIVAPIEYDEFGRSLKNYLPYVTSTNGMYQAQAVKGGDGNYASSSQSAFYANPAFKNDGIAFSTAIIEKSPIGRVLQQGSVGSNWQPNEADPSTANTMKLNYRHNADNSIKKLSYNYSGSSPALVLGNYTANQLQVTETKDEKNNIVEEYSDNYGRVVCKIVFNGTEKIKTYNAFDDFGRLRFVFPPKASDILEGKSAGTIDPKTDTELKDLIFFYDYDARGRITQKKVADADPEEMVYNPFNQVVLYRNALHKSKNIWMYTKYDELGRKVSSGILNSSQDRVTLQAAVYAMFADGTVEYGDNAYPTTSESFIEKTRNYYDAYPTISGVNTTAASVDEFSLGNLSCNTCSITLVDKLTASKEVVEVPAGATTIAKTELYTTYFYDEYGRTVQTRSQNHLDKEDISSVLYDFAGRVLETKSVEHSFTTNPYKVWNKNMYDPGNRLKMTLERITDANGTVGKIEPVGRYKYNELGELIEKWQGCKQQVVSYQTNIKGWLLNINGTANPTELAAQKKFFGMTLSYDQKDGSIIEQAWGTVPNFRTGTTLPALRKYNYTYDALNRLTGATYTGGTNENFDISNLTYDKNGNILTMNRRVQTPALGDSPNEDNLKYFYPATSNRLRNVKDLGIATPTNAKKNHYFNDRNPKDETNGYDNNTATDDYVYDNAGNIIEDRNRALKLYYNYLGLPEKITYNNITDIYYIYTSRGEKIQKQGAPLPRGGGVGGGPIISTNIDYKGSHTYVNGILEHIETAEGRALPALTVSTAVPSTSLLTQGFRYEYIQTDYFGNPRTACRCGEKTDEDGNIIPTLVNEDARTLVQENHFDPWGLNLAEIEGKTIKQQNWWQFNSDTEKGYMPDGSFDYETSFRNYDAQIGRFKQIDLLADDTPGINGYHFAYNNPILFSDRTGLQSNLSNLPNLLDEVTVKAKRSFRPGVMPFVQVNTPATRTPSIVTNNSPYKGIEKVLEKSPKTPSGGGWSKFWKVGSRVGGTIALVFTSLDAGPSNMVNTDERHPEFRLPSQDDEQTFDELEQKRMILLGQGKDLEGAEFANYWQLHNEKFPWGRILNKRYKGLTHPVTGVMFDAEGFPDFTPYLYKPNNANEKHTVKIIYTGSRDQDFALANKLAGFKRTPEGYTWHHHQDMTTMMLVETAVHGKTSHTGGVSIWQIKYGIKYKN